MEVNTHGQMRRSGARESIEHNPSLLRSSNLLPELVSFCQFYTARVIWEEEASVEKMLAFDWSVGKSVGAFS